MTYKKLYLCKSGHSRSSIEVCSNGDHLEEDLAMMTVTFTFTVKLTFAKKTKK